MTAPERKPISSFRVNGFRYIGNAATKARARLFYMHESFVKLLVATRRKLNAGPKRDFQILKSLARSMVAF
jgi:hypothetical protein